MLTKEPSAITAEGFFIGSFYNGNKIKCTYDVVGRHLRRKITYVHVFRTIDITFIAKTN